MNQQVVKVKGIPVDFSGETLIVPPLSLGSMEQLMPRLNKFQADPKNMTDVAIVVDSALAALNRNYPALTRDQVADMIGLENMNDVMEALMDVSGLKRKAKEAAELAEAGEGKA